MSEEIQPVKRHEGLLIVVSGPSAVGKDTVLDALMADYDPQFPIQKCVTTTTRPPRPKEGGQLMEEEGVDYNFVSLTLFNQMAANDEFFEYAEVHGAWYGTPKKWVDCRLQQGIDVILKIDVQGGRAVKKKSADAVLIFLQPPSFHELERRLRNRASDGEEEIAKRLLNARSELAQRPYYDYAVTNETVLEAVATIRAILTAEHCRIHTRGAASDG